MNRKIIVTGSRGGIGKAVMKSLNDEGIGLDVKKGWDITQEIDRLDVYDKYKEINGIAICHGITNRCWDYTLDVNLNSIYKFLELMHNRMKKRGGSIVNVTSLSSFQGFPNNPQYVASKGGLKQLTKALAVDWGKYNIRVNNVCPGYIRTDMTKRSYKNKTIKKERDNRIILNRWGTPKDVASAIVFLLSSRAKYITGTDLVVDGGWLAKGL